MNVLPVSFEHSNPQMIQQKLLKSDFHGAVLTGTTSCIFENVFPQRNTFFV